MGAGAGSGAGMGYVPGTSDMPTGCGINSGLFLAAINVVVTMFKDLGEAAPAVVLTASVVVYHLAGFVKFATEKVKNQIECVKKFFAGLDLNFDLSENVSKLKDSAEDTYRSGLLDLMDYLTRVIPSSTWEGV